MGEGTLSHFNKHCKGDKAEIGRIDLLGDYTLFDVRSKDAKRVVGSLKNANFYGVRIYAEIAVPGKDYGQKRGKRGDKLEKESEEKSRRRNRQREETIEAPKKAKHDKKDKYPTDFFDFEPAQPNQKKRKREARAEKKHHGSYEIFKKKKWWE